MEWMEWNGMEWNGWNERNGMELRDNIRYAPRSTKESDLLEVNSPTKKQKFQRVVILQFFQCEYGLSDAGNHSADQFEFYRSAAVPTWNMAVGAV